MFRNTLTANNKYPFREWENSSSLNQMQFSVKLKTFSGFPFHFWNLHQILNILKQQMIVIASLLQKSQAVKDLFRPFSKKKCFRTPFESQHVKASQTLVNSTWEHFHHIFSSLWENLTWKISPLVICQILGIFRNTLTANDKYAFLDWENLPTPTQMQWSFKPKTFSDFLNLFPEYTSKFEDFEK